MRTTICRLCSILLVGLLVLPLAGGCKGAGGGGSGGSSISSPPPGPDPEAPGGTVDLQWNGVVLDVEGNPETVAGYRVFVSQDPSDFGDPAGDVTTTEITLVDLVAGVTYYVAVEAYDSAGNISAPSEPFAIQI